jgi:UTP:GlnB (protein PII) uridylyltransferase
MQPAALVDARAESTLSDFVASMPDDYARQFGLADMREHAEIVLRRRGAPGAATLWRRLSGDQVVFCMVADDRPGLLALMSDALGTEALDVIGAHVYRRSLRHAPAEIVAFFWLRRDPRSHEPRAIADEEAASVGFSLAELCLEQQKTDAELAAASEHTLANPKAAVRVYFDTKALRAGEAVLVVSAPDCPGLLLAVTRSLFKRRAEIIASEIRTEDGVALDRFTICGTGGAPLGPDSLADIQQQVLSTVRRLQQRFLHQD